MIRGKCRGVPTTEQAEEFCAMANNSDDGEPRPNVIERVLK